MTNPTGVILLKLEILSLSVAYSRVVVQTFLWFSLLCKISSEIFAFITIVLSSGIYPVAEADPFSDKRGLLLRYLLTNTPLHFH